MSTEQRETLDAILRQPAFPADSDVNEQRQLAGAERVTVEQEAERKVSP